MLVQNHILLILALELLADHIMIRELNRHKTGTVEQVNQIEIEINQILFKHKEQELRLIKIMKVEVQIIQKRNHKIHDNDLQTQTMKGQKALQVIHTKEEIVAVHLQLNRKVLNIVLHHQDLAEVTIQVVKDQEAHLEVMGIVNLDHLEDLDKYKTSELIEIIKVLMFI